jgi:hypothetical protein
VLVASHSSNVSCPACQSSRVERQFSTFAAHGSPSPPACPSGKCPMAGGSCPGSGGPCHLG